MADPVDVTFNGNRVRHRIDPERNLIGPALRSEPHRHHPRRRGRALQGLHRAGER